MTLCAAFHDERAGYLIGDSLTTYGQWYAPYGPKSSLGEQLPISHDESYAENALKLWKGPRHVAAVAGTLEPCIRLLRELARYEHSPATFAGRVENILGKDSSQVEFVVTYVDKVTQRPRVDCWATKAGGVNNNLLYCVIGNTETSDLHHVVHRLAREIREMHDYPERVVLHTWLSGIQAASLKLRTAEMSDGIGGTFVGAYVSPGETLWQEDSSFNIYDAIPPMAPKNTIHNIADTLSPSDGWESLRSVAVQVREHVVFVGPCEVQGKMAIKALAGIHLGPRERHRRVRRLAPSIAPRVMQRPFLVSTFMRSDGSTVLAYSNEASPLVAWRNGGRDLVVRDDLHRMLASVPKLEMPDAIAITVANGLREKVLVDSIVVGILGEASLRKLTNQFDGRLARESSRSYDET